MPDRLNLPHSTSLEIRGTVSRTSTDNDQTVQFSVVTNGRFAVVGYKLIEITWSCPVSVDGMALGFQAAC